VAPGIFSLPALTWELLIYDRGTKKMPPEAQETKRRQENARKAKIVADQEFPAASCPTDWTAVFLSVTIIHGPYPT